MTETDPAKDSERLAEIRDKFQRACASLYLEVPEAVARDFGTIAGQMLVEHDKAIARRTQERDEREQLISLLRERALNAERDRDEARRSAEALKPLLQRAADKLCHYATDYPQPDTLAIMNDCDRALAHGHYSDGHICQPTPDDVERARENKEDTHQRYYLAFHDWFSSDNSSCDFWSECDAPEALATIAVEIHDAALTAARREGFKEAIDKTTPGWRDLNMALRMIRDAVEELGPVGAVPSRDVGPPNYAQDAEDIITGITSLVDAARHESAEAAYAREGTELRALDEAVVEAARNLVILFPLPVGSDSPVAKLRGALAARDAALHTKE